MIDTVIIERMNRSIKLLIGALYVLGLGLIISLGSIIFFVLHIYLTGFALVSTWVWVAMAFVCSAVCTVAGIVLAAVGMKMLVKS